MRSPDPPHGAESDRTHDLHAGSIYVDFPAICNHFGWAKGQYCGPVVTATCPNPEENCIWGHAKGCAMHQPMLNGKPFKFLEHKDELTRLGLTSVKAELKADAAANRKPPGKPKNVNGVLVYPKRHFA